MAFQEGCPSREGGVHEAAVIVQPIFSGKQKTFLGVFSMFVFPRAFRSGDQKSKTKFSIFQMKSKFAKQSLSSPKTTWYWEGARPRPKGQGNKEIGCSLPTTGAQQGMSRSGYAATGIRTRANSLEGCEATTTPWLRVFKPPIIFWFWNVFKAHSVKWLGHFFSF